jgi:hypothetical protein
MIFLHLFFNRSAISSSCHYHPLSVGWVFLDHFLSYLPILYEHNLSHRLKSESTDHIEDQGTEAITNIQSNNGHAAVAHGKLVLSFLNKIGEANDMIAHKDGCNFVQNFLTIYGLVYERLGISEVNDKELGTKYEYNNLDCDLLVHVE